MTMSNFESGPLRFLFLCVHLWKEKFSYPNLVKLALRILILFVMLLDENDNDNHYH